MLRQMAMSNMTRTQAELTRLTEQVVSGKKVRRPSDDPVSTSSILTTSSGIRAVQQYQRNLAAADTRLRLEESVLEQVTDTVQRARELAVSQGSDTATAQTRQAVKAEVDELREFVRTLGNTRLGNSYLFGGEWAQTEPFPDLSGPDPARPPEGEFAIEVGSGQTALTNHSGQRVFVDTGLMAELEALSNALDANDAEAIRESAGRLYDVDSEIQTLVGDVGARSRRLEVATANLEALELNLRTFRSDLEDVELEEAITDLVSRQSSFEAALAANARLFSTSLNDYLR
jgi:flagellar hook-associated protein 3 FlgL